MTETTSADVGLTLGLASLALGEIGLSITLAASRGEPIPNDTFRRLSSVTRTVVDTFTELAAIAERFDPRAADPGEILRTPDSSECTSAGAPS